jgi:hypothetical protein
VSIKYIGDMMNLFFKFMLSFFLFSILSVNFAYSDWTTVIFFKNDGTNLGTAEGADSWFLNAPAFKFNLKNLEPGIYRIALYDGDSCNNYGISAAIKNPKLKAWHTEKLLILEVNDKGLFNTTLGVKPKVFNEETRNLVSIGSLRGYPLILFKVKNNEMIACGLVPKSN